jgi:hypothetical protein
VCTIPLQAERAKLVLEALRLREIEHSARLTAILRGDAQGGVSEDGSMNECGFCRLHVHITRVQPAHTMCSTDYVQQ